MNPDKNNKNFDELIKGAIGRDGLKFDFNKWKNEHKKEVQIYKSQTTEQKKRLVPIYNIGRIIMKSRIAKFAAAATIIIVVGLLLFSNNTIVPTVYALQDTINAHNSIRYLHVKELKTVFGQKWHTESWVEFDEYGKPARFRHYADRISTGEEMGAVTLVNDGNGTYTWMPNFNLCFRRSGESVVALQWEVSDVDPKLVFEKLQEQAEEGEIILDINEPDQKSEPIVLVVTYPPESRSANWKKVLYVDQATRLVKKEDKFEMRDGEYQHVQTNEFSDYNQEIDSKMFNIKEELPKNIFLIDQSDKEVGLAQGNMSNEEIAIELTSQFLQAAMINDSNKIGQLYFGVPGFLVERLYSGGEFKIISIGPVSADSDPDSSNMKCKYKVRSEEDGKNYESDTELQVTPVSGQPGRWMICGMTTFSNPVSNDITQEE